MDLTSGIDEVAVAHRVLGILLVRSAHDFVGGPDCTIHVAQQMEREVLCLGEREVLGRGVERCAEDDGIELLESVGAVTQALTLDRSTRRRRLRVPPQQDPVTPEILEVDVPATLVRQFEVRRNGVQRQHHPSLPDLDGRVIRVVRGRPTRPNSHHIADKFILNALRNTHLGGRLMGVERLWVGRTGTGAPAAKGTPRPRRSREHRALVHKRSRAVPRRFVAGASSAGLSPTSWAAAFHQSTTEHGRR